MWSGVGEIKNADAAWPTDGDTCACPLETVELLDPQVSDTAGAVKVEDIDLAVVTGAGQVGAVGRPRHRAYPAGVTGQNSDQRGGWGVRHTGG